MIWWCQEHKSSGWDTESCVTYIARSDMHQERGVGRFEEPPCRMVEALLIVKENGEWPERMLRAIPMSDVDDGPLDGVFRRRANRVLDALASVGEET